MDDLLLDAESLDLPITSATHLGEQYRSLITALDDKDPGSIYDQSRTLIETIFRTIIENRNGVVHETSNRRATLNELYVQARDTLSAHETDVHFLPIVKRVVSAIGDMRNNYGFSGHGRDGYTERVLTLEEAVFVARMTLTTAGYFFARHNHTSADGQNVRLHYEDNKVFNEYLDEFGDVEVAGIFVVPSRTLFDNDPIAYKDQLLEFRNVPYLVDMYLDTDYQPETA